MRQEYSNTNNLPTCPVCGSQHRRATNGYGYLVWCDGSLAETLPEYEARIKALAKYKQAQADAATQFIKDKQTQAKAKAKQRRAHTKAKLLHRAGVAQRTDEAPIDAIDVARFLESLGREPHAN